jgi:glycosyltransferase involved in cell wall biosynthesis
VTRGMSVAAALVLEPHDAVHPLVESLRQVGVSVHPIVVGGRNYMGEYRAISKIVRMGEWQIVHTHGYRSDVVGGLVARRENVPVISTLHGFTARTVLGKVVEWLQIESLKKFNGVVGVSQAIIDRVARSGVPPVALKVIPNAWTPPLHALDRTGARAALTLPQNTWVVGWVGRLSREKGADIMIQAWAQRTERSGVLAMVGDGLEGQRLRLLSQQLGVADSIHWCGPIEAAGRYMRAFDALALSSRTEGVPMVVLEAMGARVPIIATRVGGVPFVLNASTATLIDKESPAQLAAALDDLHSRMPAAIERAGRAFARVSQEFAVAPWLDRYLTEYTAAIRRNQADR